MKVRNMFSSNGNKVANQFIIDMPENVTVFQSYETVIALKHDSNVTLDVNALNYSATTLKYLKQFLGTNDSKKQLQVKIDNGFYSVKDLNN